MPTFEDGETGLSVRTKINSAIATVDQIVNQGGENTLVFASRAAFVQWVLDGNTAENGAIASDGTVQYVASAGATSIADLNGWLPFGQITPLHFGENVTPGTTDMAPAIQAAVNYMFALAVAKSVRLSFPPSRYRVNSSIDFSNTGGKRCEVIGGNAVEAAEIICGYNTAGGDAVFQQGDEDAPSGQTTVVFSGFLFNSVATQDPIGIQTARSGQGRMSDITFGGWNNVCVSMADPQNVRTERLTTFSGGVAWEYKDASAVTVTQSGTTLTSSGSIFSASDVGKTVAIWGTGSSTYRRHAQITAYTSPTQVTVAKSVTDATPRELYFGSPGATISAAGTTLTVDASCFSAAQVGLPLWIKGAGDNGGLHRAKIASFTSATEVELDAAAITSVSGAEFTTPSFEVYRTPGASNGPSDIRMTETQIEGHQGVGLCLLDVDIFHFEGKIHGEQDVASDDYALSAVWADRWNGTYRGDFDAQYIGASRAYVTNQSSCVTFSNVFTRAARDEVIFSIGERLAINEGSMVVISGLQVSGADPSASLEAIVSDDNVSIPGYSVVGAVSFINYNSSRFFVGPSFSTDDGGNIDLAGNPFPIVRRTSWTPEVADAATGGNVATGTFTGTYTRVGDMVTLSARLVDIDTTGLTGGASLYIRNLPIPLAGGTSSIGAGSVRMENVTFTGAPAVFADDADSALLIYQTRSGLSSSPIQVSDLASGTADIRFSVTYIA